MEQAAVKIQTRQRGIKARETSKHQRTKMLVWLYGLFDKIREANVELAVLAACSAHRASRE